MELAVELLAKILERREITGSFPTLDLDAQGLLESASYQAPCHNQAILKDHAPSAPECFQKIEAVVQTLEDMGVSCGNRHDFG